MISLSIEMDSTIGTGTPFLDTPQSYRRQEDDWLLHFRLILMIFLPAHHAVDFSPIWKRLLSIAIDADIAVPDD